MTYAHFPPFWPQEQVPFLSRMPFHCSKIRSQTHSSLWTWLTWLQLVVDSPINLCQGNTRRRCVFFDETTVESNPLFECTAEIGLMTSPINRQRFADSVWLMRWCVCRLLQLLQGCSGHYSIMCTVCISLWRSSWCFDVVHSLVCKHASGRIDRHQWHQC